MHFIVPVVSGLSILALMSLTNRNEQILKPTAQTIHDMIYHFLEKDHVANIPKFQESDPGLPGS